MIILKYFFWISTLWLLRAFEIIKPRSEDEIKIAFGSGNNKALDERTKIFYSVARYGPDIWIWLGFYFFPSLLFSNNIKQIYNYFRNR